MNEEVAHPFGLPDNVELPSAGVIFGSPLSVLCLSAMQKYAPDDLEANARLTSVFHASMKSYSGSLVKGTFVSAIALLISGNGIAALAG